MEAQLRYWDSTISLAKDKRPSNWLELSFDTNCKGKVNCEIPVAPFNVATLKGVINQRYPDTYAYGWKYTKETQNEISYRFYEGMGYNYWSQFLNTQPNFMMVAECKVGDVYEPLLRQYYPKEKLGTVIVLFDIIVVMLYIVFIRCLESC